MQCFARANLCAGKQRGGLVLVREVSERHRTFERSIGEVKRSAVMVQDWFAEWCIG